MTRRDYKYKIQLARNFLEDLRRNSSVPISVRVQATKLCLELGTPATPAAPRPLINYSVHIGGLPDTSGRRSPVGIERCYSFLEDMAAAQKDPAA